MVVPDIHNPKVDDFKPQDPPQEPVIPRNGREWCTGEGGEGRGAQGLLAQLVEIGYLAEVVRGSRGGWEANSFLE